MNNKAQITYRFERPAPYDRKDTVRPSNEHEASMQGHDDEIIEVPTQEVVVYEQEGDVQEGRPEFMQSDEPLAAKRDADYDWSHFANYHTWQSPFDIETEELEKMIRDAGRPPHANQEQVTDAEADSEGHAMRSKAEHDDDHETARENQKDRMEQENDRLYDYKVDIYGADRDSSHVMRRSPKSWGKMMAAVLGAIVTGSLFGIFILSLFTPGEVPSSPDLQRVPNGQQVTGIEPNQPVELGDEPDFSSSELEDVQSPQILPIPATEESEHIVRVNIPSKSYYVLQNGMFSTLEGAERAMQQLSSQGFAAASEWWDHYYVYAGISVNRDDALLMSHMLHEEDYETYIKMVTLPAVRFVQWQSESAESLQDYIVQGNQLAEMISSLTVIHLQQATATEMDASFVETINKAHQSWNSLSATVHEGMPEKAKSTIQKMDTALNTTSLLLEAYRKNPSFSYIWQTQTALIDYVILQKQLLQMISVR